MSSYYTVVIRDGFIGMLNGRSDMQEAERINRELSALGITVAGKFRYVGFFTIIGEIKGHSRALDAFNNFLYIYDYVAYAGECQTELIKMTK